MRCRSPRLSLSCRPLPPGRACLRRAWVGGLDGAALRLDSFRSRTVGAMAQLSNDCFAFGGELLSLDAARALISERLAPVAGTETVPLVEADGRVLAEDVIAPIDLPPFDNSAVDGYAVRFFDLRPSGDTVLPVAGRIAAGASLTETPGAGA